MFKNSIRSDLLWLFRYLGLRQNDVHARKNDFLTLFLKKTITKVDEMYGFYQGALVGGGRNWSQPMLTHFKISK